MRPCQRIQTVLIGLNELLQKIKNVELGEDILYTGQEDLGADGVDIIKICCIHV